MGTNLCKECYFILKVRSGKEWDQYCMHPIGGCENCGKEIPPFDKSGSAYLICDFDKVSKYLKGFYSELV